MENTALASTLHTSGCLKNGSPLMWWLHGFSLKVSFRKKNTLFRCAFALFHPHFLSFDGYIISFVGFFKVLIQNHHWHVVNSSLTYLFICCCKNGNCSGCSWFQTSTFLCIGPHVHVLCVWVWAFIRKVLLRYQTFHKSSKLPWIEGGELWDSGQK